MSKIRISSRLALDLRNGRLVYRDEALQASTALLNLRGALQTVTSWRWMHTGGSRPLLIGRPSFEARRFDPRGTTRVVVEWAHGYVARVHLAGVAPAIVEVRGADLYLAVHDAVARAATAREVADDTDLLQALSGLLGALHPRR